MKAVKKMQRQKYNEDISKIEEAGWNRVIRFRLDKHVIRAHVLEVGGIGA